MKRTRTRAFQEVRNLFLRQHCTKKKIKNGLKYLNLRGNICKEWVSWWGGILLVLSPKMLVFSENTEFMCLCSKSKVEKFCFEKDSPLAFFGGLFSIWTEVV